MYCIQCGAQLADSEINCPLCGLRVYHPDLERPHAPRLYPENKRPRPLPRTRSFAIMSTILLLIPVLVTLVCDLRLSGRITWSGFVIGALLLGYEILVLPLWFRRPNPIVFVPCGFAAAALYLLYIDLIAGGGWFLPFALPVIGYLALTVTAVTVLVRCLRRGRLYIFGCALIALGAMMPLLEVLIVHTFSLPRFTAWSLYPLISLVLLGCALIFLAICRPARATVERKFFF